MLEAALLLLAGAALPETPVRASARPSVELLEFLADWPDDTPIAAAPPVLAPSAGVRRDEPRPDHD